MQRARWTRRPGNDEHDVDTIDGLCIPIGVICTVDW
jgi:hypothetical protein